jgi:hypothetical protein
MGMAPDVPLIAIGSAPARPHAEWPPTQRQRQRLLVVIKRHASLVRQDGEGYHARGFEE